MCYKNKIYLILYMDEQYKNLICHNCGHSCYILKHAKSNHDIFDQMTMNGIMSWNICCNKCCYRHKRDDVYYKYDMKGHQDLINKNIILKQKIEVLKELKALKERIQYLEEEYINVFG